MRATSRAIIATATLSVIGIGARQRWQAVVDLVLARHPRNGSGRNKPAKGRARPVGVIGPSVNGAFRHHAERLVY
jgi:hypothetical protein